MIDPFRKKECDLLVFDLDGTLLNAEHRIPQSLRAMLLTLRQSGIETTLATGRPFASVKNFIVELELTLPLITFNGAVVITPDGEPLSVQPLPLATARTILTRLEATSAANHLYLNPADDYFYTDRRWKPTDHFMQRDRMNYEYSSTLGAVLSEFATDPVKMFSIGPRAELEQVQQWIQESGPSVSCFFSEQDLIEFLAPGVNKGMALRFLCDTLGWTPNSVIAFGNNMNDLEMLQVAGTGVAMAASPEGLLRAADWCINDIEAFLANRFYGI